MNKTKGLILKVLEGREMKTTVIMKKLKEEKYSITPDTLAKNLKSMVNEGILSRYAKGGEVNENTGRRHWGYYYRLKQK